MLRRWPGHSAAEGNADGQSIGEVMDGITNGDD